MSITVHPFLSPRIIEISEDITEITVQELVDQIRDWEDDAGLSYDKLLDAEGKASLGGGKAVGITMILQNARVMFAARTTPLEQGTCTTGDPKGKTLHASAGQFGVSGSAIYNGCTVVNETTGALAVVNLVVSDIELRHFALSGGSRADWQIGDLYTIYPNVRCVISGGNFVAVDENGAELDPILPSTNTQAVIEKDTSAAIVTAAGAGGDWSDPEKAMIRDALGVTGSKTTATGGQLQTLASALERVLGLVQENFVIKNQSYTQIQGQYHLTAATIKTYPTAVDAGNDTNEIAEYALTASYDGNGNCTEYKVVLV